MGRSRASELRSIGKIKYFRENRLEVRQIKVFLMLAVSGCALQSSTYYTLF
jgi:hypothetical protein